MSADKKRFSAFAAEALSTLPAEVVVWETMSGNVTAGKMLTLLQERHQLGLQWVSDFVRVHRDLFTSKAEHDAPMSPPSDEFIEIAAELDKKAFVTVLTEQHLTSEVIYSSSHFGKLTRYDLVEALKNQSPAGDEFVAQFVKSFKLYLSFKAQR